MGLKYRPELDGLRAVAAYAVLFHHSGVPGFAGGGRGVDVFFVLSGYLITSLILAEPISVAEFYRRRVVRLVPALIAMLLAAVAFDPSLWRDALISGAYLFDFEMAFHNHPTPLNHLWSLAVEMQFYAVWPLVLPWVLANPRRRLVLIWSLMTLARTVLAIVSPTPHLAYNLPIAHASGIVLGALVAFCRPRDASAWPMLLLVALFALPNGSALQMNGEIWLAEVSAAALLLTLGADGPLRRSLSAEPLRRLGLISYGVYLWHYPLLWAMPQAWDWRLRAPVAFIGATALAALSYLTVERWATRRLSRKRQLAVGDVDEGRSLRGRVGVVRIGELRDRG